MMPPGINPFTWFMSHGFKSALITLFALYALIPSASRLKLMDYPTNRKKHQNPTPLIGGISIFLGLIYLMLVDFQLWMVTFLAAAVLLLGIADDRHDLQPKSRLLYQSGVIILAIFSGSMHLKDLGCLISSSPLYIEGLSPLLTFFLVLTFINAMNMLDGMDGLLASILIGQCIFLFGFALIIQEPVMSTVLIGLIFSLVLFLYFNVPNPWRKHARVFLGDAGSTFLAFIIMWIAIGLSQKSKASSIPPISIFWSIYFPFIEIYATCALRISKGMSPTKASHDHLHYLLVKKGFSKKRTILVLFALSSFYGFLGLILFWLRIPEYIQFLILWVNCFAYASIIKKLDKSLIGPSYEESFDKLVKI